MIKPAATILDALDVGSLGGRMSGRTPLEDMPGGFDPDIRRLWAMSLGEFAEIEEDVSHPLHEKARIVGRAMMAPFAETIRAQSAGVGREITKSFGRWATTALRGGVLATPMGTGVDEAPTEDEVDPITAEADRALSSSGDAALTLPALTLSGTGTVVDFSQDDLPDATVAEVHDAAQEAVIRILTTAVEVQQRQLEHLQAEAVKSDARLTEESRRAKEREAREAQLERKLDARNIDNFRQARSSSRGSWTATVVAALGILVTIAIAIWPKN